MKKLIFSLMLPICACALTACGGGGGGGGGSVVATSFDTTDWSAHPGAETAAEQSTTSGEPLAGKTMIVTRTTAEGDSGTTLAYAFTPGLRGSYTCTQEGGTTTQVISSYTYRTTSKTAATLAIDIIQEGATTRHEYTISFASAKAATGTLEIGTQSLEQLNIQFQ